MNEAILGRIQKKQNREREIDRLEHREMNQLQNMQKREITSTMYRCDSISGSHRNGSVFSEYPVSFNYSKWWPVSAQSVNRGASQAFEYSGT